MQTRQELTDQLDKLYATRGAALLDGKRMDHGAISKLENELRALDDAESEKVRREREKADAARAAECRRLVSSISKLEDARLVAWSDYQIAIRTAREAATRIVQNSAQERELVAQVAPVPAALIPNNVLNDIGGYTMEELCTVPGATVRLGSAVMWAGRGGIYQGVEDWREAQARKMEIPLKALEDEIL